MGRTDMGTQKVGIREFRAGLAEYIASDVPIAVTRHGHTVGFFIPARADRTADIAALKAASAKLDQMLDLSQSDLDVIVEEFDSWWMPTS
jgi:antitoxin (DNA-binding transcriptional repressor) of toxin-antitoxin stability system